MSATTHPVALDPTSEAPSLTALALANARRRLSYCESMKATGAAGRCLDFPSPTPGAARARPSRWNTCAAVAPAGADLPRGHGGWARAGPGPCRGVEVAGVRPISVVGSSMIDHGAWEAYDNGAAAPDDDPAREDRKPSERGESDCMRQALYGGRATRSWRARSSKTPLAPRRFTARRYFNGSRDSARTRLPRGVRRVSASWAPNASQAVSIEATASAKNSE
jgi:hypothetical protein